MGRSVVFATWRQCAPRLVYGSLAHVSLRYIISIGSVGITVVSNRQTYKQLRYVRTVQR